MDPEKSPLRFFDTKIVRASWAGERPDTLDILAHYGQELLVAAGDAVDRLQAYVEKCAFYFSYKQDDPVPMPGERPGDFYLRRREFSDTLEQFYEAFDPFAIALRMQLCDEAMQNSSDTFRASRDKTLNLCNTYQRDPYRLHALKREP